MFNLFFHSFRKQQGSSAYLIEVGGSSYMGMFGYLTAFEEMMNQVKQVDCKLCIKAVFQVDSFRSKCSFYCFSY